MSHPLRLFTWFSTACLVLLAGMSLGAQDWEMATRKASKGDVVRHANRALTLEPKSAQEVLNKLAVLLRAGVEGEAVVCIQHLKASYPDIGFGELHGIYDSARRAEAWDVVKALVESFSGRLTNVHPEHDLIPHLSKAWSPARVDRWLAALLPPEKPWPRLVGLDDASPHEYWLDVRLEFCMEHGMGEARVQELQTAARSGALSRLMVLLRAMRRWQQIKVDLDWIPGQIKPKRAGEIDRLAGSLESLGRWDLALGYRRQSLETPLTDAEIAEINQWTSVPWTGQDSSKLQQEAHTVHSMEALANCLLSLGRKEEAQAWMVKAEDNRTRHQGAGNPLFAGHVQRQSGQRTIEMRIVKADEASKEDPNYWLNRAEYFRGRKEPIQEENALNQALALPSKDRSWIMVRYVDFLARVKGPAKAVEALRSELSRSINAASASWAVDLLLRNFAKELDVEDPLLWAWLAKREQWNDIEESLLMELLARTQPEHFEACLRRAEGLAAESHPSRPASLGCALARLGAPTPQRRRELSVRARPHLLRALSGLKDPALRRSVTSTLFMAHLDVGDWKAAEGLYNNVFSSKHDRSYSQIAVCAAQRGAKADAMRIWTRFAAVEPTDLRDLGALAEAGMEKELAVFYGEMQKRMPASQVPARALKLLKVKE